MKINIYARQTKSIVEEDAYKVEGLLFLYHTKRGRLLTNALLKRRIISKAYGQIMQSRRSLKQIPKFIEHYHINLNEVERPLHSFTSFNDFFIRKLKPGARPVDRQAKHLISPADARLFIFKTGPEQDFPEKGYWYQLNDLVKDAKLSAEYLDG